MTEQILDEVAYEQKVRAFIIENFLYGELEGFEDSLSLLEEGVVDSTGILQLVTYLEKEFSIVVEDEELVPENLDSVERIKKFLLRKIGLTGSQ